MQQQLVGGAQEEKGKTGWNSVSDQITMHFLQRVVLCIFCNELCCVVCVCVCVCVWFGVFLQRQELMEVHVSLLWWRWWWFDAALRATLSFIYVSDRTNCRGAFPSTRCFFFFFLVQRLRSLQSFMDIIMCCVMFCSVFFLASNGRAWRQRVVR
jgi:hypothetical protein